MKTTDESVLAAMDGNDARILPYLPYILQDFWEIGSNPEALIHLIRKYHPETSGLRVLDLGCGKGAVSVKIASQLQCTCHGIDAIPEFISYASAKANEYGVGHLCRFEVADIREAVKSAAACDVIILGSIGQVFGNYFETLNLLRNNLKEDGIILVDDGYLKEDEATSDAPLPALFRKSEIEEQIARAGMVLKETAMAEEEEHTAEDYDTQYDYITRRCNELSLMHPEKAAIFSQYCARQKEEYDNMKQVITCATMVVTKG